MKFCQRTSHFLKCGCKGMAFFPTHQIISQLFLRKYEKNFILTPSTYALRHIFEAKRHIVDKLTSRQVDELDDTTNSITSFYASAMRLSSAKATYNLYISHSAHARAQNMFFVSLMAKISVLASIFYFKVYKNALFLILLENNHYFLRCSL